MDVDDDTPPKKRSTLIREQLGLLTTDDAGGRQYCEAERTYSIKNTIFSSKAWLGSNTQWVNDLLCGICNDRNKEENSDDSSCNSTENCFDEGEEGEDNDIALKFVGVSEF
eukprot:2656944-Ditylum_brightwellii.AAC.2